MKFIEKNYKYIDVKLENGKKKIIETWVENVYPFRIYLKIGRAYNTVYFHFMFGTRRPHTINPPHKSFRYYYHYHINYCKALFNIPDWIYKRI